MLALAGAVVVVAVVAAHAAAAAWVALIALWRLRLPRVVVGCLQLTRTAAIVGERMRGKRVRRCV